MKRRFITVILILICAALCLAGCNNGKYIENGGGSVISKPDTPVKPDNPDDMPSEETASYTAAVFYDNAPFDPKDMNIYVVWVNNSQVKKVPLGADGKADAGKLDGQFNVYLEGLPSKYSYNPGGYVATSESASVAILLTDITAPERGDGKGLYESEGCYQIKYDGTYRVVLERERQEIFYEYVTSASGVYSVESWVNVYDNNVNPYVVKYSGSSQFKYNPQKQDGGGFSISGGYTKNFRFEYKVDRSEVGGTFTFAVGAESKTSAYPVVVDFHIKYEGEYVSENADVREKRAEEANTQAEEKQAGEAFVWADLNTKVFNMSNYRYNEKTKFYHYYNETEYADDSLGYGTGFGPILCCMIMKTAPSYSTTSLFNANAVGPFRANYLRIYNCWLEEESKFVVYDYVKFIREDYAGVCNSDGVCYVTEELKQLLQKFAENHSLYTDGVGAVMGTPEIKGYSANQDALWLFACGFYR